jgi:hypothetical protein
MHKFLPFLALCFGLIFHAKAQQTSCAQTLRLARSTYEQGRLHELPELLKNCLAGGFTKSEKVEAYKLLTLSYLYLEEPEKADEAMLNLLQTDHYFEINPAVDPAEFVALYKTFRTTPIYRFGGKAGAIATQPNVVNGDEITEGNSQYKRGFGFTFGLAGEVPLSSRITLNPEIYFQLNNFNYSNKFNTSKGEFNTSALQKLTYISLPLAIQFKLFNETKRRVKFNPYLTAGLSIDYLLSGTIKAEKKRTGFQPIESGTFSIDSQREKINISPIVGAGIKLRAAGGFAIAEVRYRYGLTSVNNKATQYDSHDLIFNYHYLDSIFKLNTLSFTLGYVHNIFNPKKLNRK